MKVRFSSGQERGAASGYVVGVIVLVALLVGGVLLLKNVNGNKANVDKPVAVETGQFTADDGKDKATTTANSDDKTTPATTTNNGDKTTATTTASTPTTLTATGPEDFVPALVGLILAGITIYTAREYVKSRAVVRSTPRR